MPTGAYFSVPGRIGNQPDQFGNIPQPNLTQAPTLATVYPGLQQAQNVAAQNTLSRLRGELSPETINAIQDKAARFGLSAGMPGSGIAGSYGKKLLGLTTEGIQGQGLNDYLNALKAYSGTLSPTPGELLGAATSIYGTNVGAATSRYGANLGAQTAANQLAQQASQFGATFPESQRQFDVSSTLQNQQNQNQLGLSYANLGQNYLNSYLNFLS